MGNKTEDKYRPECELETMEYNHGAYAVLRLDFATPKFWTSTSSANRKIDS
jgi:hypothetical protein